MASNIASSSAAAGDAATAEKLRTGLAHKARGNAAFTQGDLKAALAAYHHAVLYLSGLESRSILGLVGENSGREGKPEDLSSDEEDAGSQPLGVQSEKHLSQVYSNMAACYLKQKNYARAIQTAVKSLKCDSGNVKAKFRKVQALRASGDVYEACRYCKGVVEGLKGKRHEAAVGEFEKELVAMEREIAVREDKARAKWKGFLGRRPDVLSSEGGEGEVGKESVDAGVTKGVVPDDS